MKQILFAIGVVLFASIGYAADATQVDTNSLSKVERLRKATGGFVMDRRDAEGQVVFLNLQKSVDTKVLAEEAVALERDCMLFVKVANADNFAAADYAKVKKGLGAKVLIVVEEKGSPFPLLVAPEQMFAVIDVSALRGDAPDVPVLARRVKKEMVRAMAMTFGTGYAVMGGGTLAPALSLTELDELPLGVLSMETSSVIQRLAVERFGFKLFKRTVYVNALKEGWAPPPKGKYQQDLWDQYHAMPTEPITIPPEKSPIK